MANVFYNQGKKAILDAFAAVVDLRVIPVMSNTTCDTENDSIATVDDFTTVDEFDGSGYTAASGGIVLTGETTSKDDTNDRAELDAADVTGLSYGNGTRQIAGFLVIDFDTTQAASVPVAFIDRTSSPIDGSDLSGITWSVEGILQI